MRIYFNMRVNNELILAFILPCPPLVDQSLFSPQKTLYLLPICLFLLFTLNCCWNFSFCIGRRLLFLLLWKGMICCHVCVFVDSFMLSFFFLALIPILKRTKHKVFNLIFFIDWYSTHKISKYMAFYIYRKFISLNYLILARILNISYYN